MTQMGKITINELIDISEKVSGEYYEILDDMKNNSVYDENDIIKKNNWIYLKEMSKYRGNIVDWLPLEKEAQVLEIMAGCGVITGKLSEKVKHVTCLESSSVKSQISAYRNMEKDNITIYVSDYTQFVNNITEKYDYIVWVDGVEDYKRIAPDYNEFGLLIEDMKKLLKVGGKLIVAVNNEFGLRYWAGYQEEVTGRYFEGIEGYPNVQGRKGFTKNILSETFQKAGYRKIKFYYPYPDYTFPVVIYSDEYMPKRGELVRNMCNFQHERLVLFDEEKVFDNLIENRLFSQYSNSYLVVAEGE